MIENVEVEPGTVKGFIVLSGEDRYLTKGHYWFQHDKSEEAFVFLERDVLNIIQDSSHWSRFPTHVIPAERTGAEVKLTGGKISIQEFLRFSR